MSTISPKSAPEVIATWLSRAQQEVDSALDAILALPALDSEDPVTRLAEAMRYAVLGGGKRLRPALTLAACEACGVPREDALPAAAAVEILHAYTLVHDDLPAMDDDTERRGKPTVHIQYDEATAILVGDALLTTAFGCLADLKRGTGQAVRVLAQRTGRDELLGGQMLDLAWQDTEPDFESLERLHRGKTGALFSAACELGGIAAGASPDICRGLADYGMDLGVAFQHADDLDDGDFPQAAEQARKRRVALATRAEKALSPIGEPAELMRQVARWIGSA